MSTMDELWQSPGWHLALDFGERLADLRQAPPSEAGAVDRRLIRGRLERWRATPPLDDEAVWQRRLAADALCPDEIEVLLGESPSALTARVGGMPAWLGEVQAAYSEDESAPFSWPDAPDDEEGRRSPFLALAEPLIHRAYARFITTVREILERRPRGPFEAEPAARAWLGHLPDLLGPLLGRTLVVEMHAARLDGRLAGATPEERFASFVAELRRREVALDLLAAYPVMARRLVDTLGAWHDAGCEFFEHLANDAPEIRHRFFGGDELGLLVAARGGVSDPHRGGRGVVLLRFDTGRPPRGGSRGRTQQLVYKPRSLGVEHAFQALLAWINERGFAPAFRTVEVFDAGDHGWMEHVETEPCADGEALGRFYVRQGALAALLHLIDGTDIHHENVLAAGEHPVLVDLETLFHPFTEGAALHGVEHLPGAPLRESPLRSGLLPQRVWGNRERAGVDISGLGAEDGQLTPQKFLTATHRGTDAMRFERARTEISASANRPRLADGTEAAFVDHAGEIEEGYRALYDVLVEHRADLGAAGGPLEAFAEVETRVLFRPTLGYALLLFESVHPHAQSNALERFFLFDRLWSDFLKRPFMAALIGAEHADLARGDIPSFTTRPGSADLWTSRGERVAGADGSFFEESGLERVRRRLAAAGPATLERELAVVRAALDAVRLNQETVNGSPPSSPPVHKPEGLEGRPYLDAARHIGERLVRTAYFGPGTAVWVSVDHGEPEGWSVTATGPDLYLGLPGIALFLAHLGALLDDDTFTAAARGALRCQDQQLAEDDSVVRGIGAFNGWGGLIWAATHLGVLWDDPALLDQAESWIPRAAHQEDTPLDLVAGSAGWIVALLALASHRPSRLLEETARACGDRLVAAATPQDGGGVGWATELTGGRALAGMSHGAAGIVLALLRLAAATGDERYRAVALEGLRYERSLFDPERRNWPDLRTDPRSFLCAWCHGAPGIALARLAGLAVHDDAEVREEIAVALETTIAEGFGHGDHHSHSVSPPRSPQGDSLCHGDLGNLDVLLEASLAFGDGELRPLGGNEGGELRSRAEHLAGGVVTKLEQGCPQFGLPGNVETPGLMLGLAGLGYGLLRCADPRRVPSLLALDAPGDEPTIRKRLPSLTARRPEPVAGGSGTDP